MPLYSPRASNPADYQTIGATADRRYYAGQVNGLAGGTPTALTVGTLYAVPFISPRRGGVLDRLGCNVTTLGAGSSVRTGLYVNTSETVLYPAALLLDGGAIGSGTTGVKEATISQPLAPSTLYWAVYECSATAPTISMLQAGGLWAVLGGAGTYTAGNTGLTVAHTFGALPNPFTASATPQNGAQPTIGMRYSA